MSKNALGDPLEDAEGSVNHLLGNRHEREPVPPVGAIVLVDGGLARPGLEIDGDWRPDAFTARGTGSALAVAVERHAPGVSTAISAAIMAGFVYPAAVRLRALCAAAT